MRSKTLILILFCCQSLYAQTTEWAPVGAKWWWSVSDLDVEGEAYYLWEVIGKDSFEGEWVSVIESDLFGYDSMVVPGYDTLFTFSRNDSVFLFHDYSGQFELLYDFGAEIGDTIWFATFDEGLFNVERFPARIYDIVLLEEGTIGSLKKGNVRLFRTTDVDGDNFFWENQYYEGFGSTYSLLVPRSNLLYGPIIRCYYDENIEFHDYYVEHSTGEIETLPCDYYRYTPTKEIVWNSDKIKLYPNPVGEFLQVELSAPLKNAEFRIIDWLGKTRSKGVAERLLAGLEVNAWEPGMYVLAIEDAERIYFQKFMIQR